MDNGTFVVGEYNKKTLDRPVLFHIVHLINISKSKLNQLDEWKEYDNPNRVSVDRLNKARKKQGPTTKIIREVNLDGNDTAHQNQTGFDTYKLLLRDMSNNYCYGYEFGPLPFLRNGGSTTSPLPIVLGAKLLVKQGAVVQNGVLLLTRQTCEYKGVDSADKSLIDQLNDGLVQKNIDILNRQLNNQ